MPSDNIAYKLNTIICIFSKSIVILRWFLTNAFKFYIMTRLLLIEFCCKDTTKMLNIQIFYYDTIKNKSKN